MVGDRFGVALGDRVATLVSLTLTPLRLRRVKSVDLHTHQVEVEGTAVVFTSGMMARLPEDLPERLALGVLDVAGAAPQITRLAKPGQSSDFIWINPPWMRTRTAPWLCS